MAGFFLAYSHLPWKIEINLKPNGHSLSIQFNWELVGRFHCDGSHWLWYRVTIEI